MYSSKRTKLINKKLILRTIWLKPGISRIEIARRLGLDKSTVTNLVAEMIAFGLIVATDEGEAGPHGGRKPIHLEINEDFACVIGFELRAASFIAVVVNLAGRILFQLRQDLPFNREGLAEAFLEAYGYVSERLKALGYRPLGVGVGISGIVDTSSGNIRFSIPLGVYEKYAFGVAVASHIDIPVFIENDANCCAWGEIAFHKAANLRDFMFVLIECRNDGQEAEGFCGVGIGIGIVIDGKVHRGLDFSAGEFRSAFWHERSSTQFSITEAEMAKLKMDEATRARFIQELCVNLALFINTLNLKQVFIGGDIELCGDGIVSILREAVNRNWPYNDPVVCDIRFSSVGDWAVAYGAAGMLLDRLFAYRIFPAGGGRSESNPPLDTLFARSQQE